MNERGVQVRRKPVKGPRGRVLYTRVTLTLPVPLWSVRIMSRGYELQLRA